MDAILKHQPSPANHTLLNTSALTIKYLGKVICRLDYLYDQLPPLPDQAEIALPPEHMHKAYDAAWVTEVVRQVALGTIFGGCGLHFLGIDVPLIGGELGAGRWGVLTGLCLQLGPIVPVSALVHTIARGHSFIGPSGLFTRGIVSATLSILVMEFCISLTKGHLEEDLKERQKLDEKYEKVYQEEASVLEKGLKEGIGGSKIPELKKRAELIQQKEEELKQIFGFNIRLFRLHLRELYLRIQEFEPEKVDPSDRELMKQIAKRFVIIQNHSQQPDIIPYNFAQQQFVLTGKVKEKTDKIPQDQTPRVRSNFCNEYAGEYERLETVTESIQEKTRIGIELDRLSVALSFQSEAALVKKFDNGPLLARAQDENNFVRRASTAEGHFKLVETPSLALQKLHRQHQAKKKQYQDFEPSSTSVMRAYVVATFFPDKTIWAEGEEQNKRNASDLGKERLKKRLEDLEKGLCDPRKFIQWVEERVFPEKQDPQAEINLKAHNLWDHFRAITKL